ncbi:MAG: trigger factor family protein, partial [Muribaculaceae bacterium]|nr:trigger factor family protein [Muribaculaceae bacterium]
MNVSKEPLSETAAKIVVKIDEADYKDKVTAELKKIGQTHTIPGFRKGHVSTAQLQRLFGRQVKSDILNREAANAVYDYIKNENIAALGSPIALDVKEINLADKDYTFEYEIALAPVLDIKLDKSVTLPFYTISVDDKMIEEQDKALRDQFGAQIPGEEADERALLKGVLQQLDADGNVATGEGAIEVLDAIVAPFVFNDKEQAAIFLGKKVGDKIVFNPAKAAGNNLAELASMLHINKEQAADVKDDFQLTVSEIIVARPAELGEEFYNNVFGPDKVHNEEEYKQALTNMIAAQLRPNSEALFSNVAQDYLLKTYGALKLPVDSLKRIILSNDPEKFTG